MASATLPSLWSRAWRLRCLNHPETSALAKIVAGV